MIDMVMVRRGRRAAGGCLPRPCPAERVGEAVRSLRVLFRHMPFGKPNGMRADVQTSTCQSTRRTGRRVRPRTCRQTVGRWSARTPGSGLQSGSGNVRRLSSRIALVCRSTASVMAGSARRSGAACRVGGEGTVVAVAGQLPCLHRPPGASGPSQLGPCRKCGGDRSCPGGEVRDIVAQLDER